MLTMNLYFYNTLWSVSLFSILWESFLQGRSEVRTASFFFYKFKVSRSNSSIFGPSGKDDRKLG